MSDNSWFVDVIYCDDVRREDTGKAIYIGVYTEAMEASEFPLTLPKFVVITRLFSPSDDTTVPNAIRLRSNQSTIVTFPKPKDMPNELGLITFEMHSTNFAIAQPCTLDVEVELADHQKIYSRPFSVRHKPGNKSQAPELPSLTH